MRFGIGLLVIISSSFLLVLAGCSSRESDDSIKDMIQDLKKSPITPKDIEEGNVQSASFRLVQIGEPAVLPLIRALKRDCELGDKVELILSRIGKTAIPYIASEISSEQVIVRHHLVRALGAIGDKSGLPTLHESLADENQSVRAQAAISLGRIKSKLSVPCLVKTLDDSDVEVRCAVCIALGDIGSTKAVKALIQKLEDQEHKIVSCAVHALTKITGKDFGEDKERWQQYTSAKN